MRGRLTPAEGWLTLGLLAALVYMTLHTVEAAGWGDRIDLAPRLALLGVGVGLLAAKSRLRMSWALLVGLIVGGEWLLVAFALTGPAAGWGDRLGWLLAALGGWLAATVARGASHDPLVFAIVMSALGYLLGYCSSWLVFRLQHGWLALVVNAAAGLVHLSYATVDSIPPFLLSLLLGTLMVASLELHLRRHTWQSIGVPVQHASTIWTLATAAGLGSLGLFVGLQLPAGTANAALAERYADLTAPWRDTQQQVERLFGGGLGLARPGGGLAFAPGLTPRESFDLGDQPVFEVVAAERHYWRARTYDRYDGHSIESAATSEQRFEAGQELPADPDGGHLRAALEQKVTVLGASASTLIAAEAPRSFSVPALVEQHAVAWDLGGLRPATPLERGQSYTVRSEVVEAGRRELAEAPAANEPWLDRYLELPIELPARIGELANRLTAGATTPLDRALAIEGYLRGLQYSTHTTVPPPDRDWVDYLLFDSQVGYCDYFATAMVVMLRTQGIPARVASGFAPGTYDDRAGAWIVRESDAHSWAEAYFPGYGWATFEPSALRPAPERPETARPAPSQAATDRARAGRSPLEDPLDELSGPLGGEALGIPREPSPLGPLLGGLAALALASGLGLALLARAWDRGLLAEPPARRRFGHLLRLLGWGGLQLPPSLTPDELVARAGQELPALREPLAELGRRYVEATYARPVRAEPDGPVEQLWQRLRGPLARALLRRRWRGRTPASGRS